MKKRFYCIIASVFVLLFCICPFSYEAFAFETDNLEKTFVEETCVHEKSGVRTEEEIDRLLAILSKLFPDQFHYIQKYLTNGVDPCVFPELIFEETRSLKKVDYTLSIYSNNVILLVVADEPITIKYIEKEERGIIPSKGGGIEEKTRTIQLGDLNEYETFYVVYYIDWADYDSIDLNRTTTSGYWEPSSVAQKQYENSSGGAYYCFKNAYCVLQYPNYIYYMGISVGNNQIVGRCSIASDWSSFLWYLINALL